MRKYLGRGQLAECQRSGIKCFAHQLVRDGRNPALLVLPEWADPPHPQERPYSPNNVEGKARYPISPDATPSIAPVLDVEVEDGDVFLTWSEADYTNPLPISPGVSPGHSAWKQAQVRVERYDVYRATGTDGAFSLLTSLPIDFGNGVDDPWVPVLEYDSTIGDGITYRYQIRAVDSYGRQITSNTVTITGDGGPAVDGVVIATADGVRSRTNDLSLAFQAANGHLSSGGVVNVGLPMRAIVCELSFISAGPSGNGGIANLSVRVHGTNSGGSAITEDITLGPAQMSAVGNTDFYSITGTTLLVAPIGGGDSFYSVGCRYLDSPGTSGFNLVAYRGAIAVDLAAVVSGTPATLNGPLANWNGSAINLAAFGTDVTFSIVKTGNTAARDFLFTGLPGNETLSLPSGSSTSAEGTAPFTQLTTLTVTAGTSTAPRVDVGLFYIEPE